MILVYELELTGLGCKVVFNEPSMWCMSVRVMCKCVCGCSDNWIRFLTSRLLNPSYTLIRDPSSGEGLASVMSYSENLIHEVSAIKR